MKPLLILFSSLLSITSNAQWSNDPSINNPICVDPNSQGEQNSIADGHGGAIIVWGDLRNGGTNGMDIYAQRINKNGIIQWTINGMAISNDTSYENGIAVVSDGNGGAIISWLKQDQFYNTHIYAQRIDSNGTKLWNSNGVPICTALNGQGGQSIISDGNGGAIIAWGDGRDINTVDIFAQRINSNGVVQWTNNGVGICIDPNDQASPVLATDGSGGAIVSWVDKRSGTFYDIYSQRISMNGTCLWTNNGIRICLTSNDKEWESIISDGNGGAIFCWQEGAFGWDIYSQRINQNGIKQWGNNGRAICTAPNIQDYPSIAEDGSGGAFISWSDHRNTSGNTDVYVQRINSIGAIQWIANGIPVELTNFDNENYPSIISDGGGGAIVSYHDFTANADDYIFAQKINNVGQVQWSGGIAVCTSFWNRVNQTAVTDGAGGAIVSWDDNLSGGDWDIYSQRINNDGTLSLADLKKETEIFNIFPNPASSHLFLELNTQLMNACEIRIFDEMGRTISKSTLIKNNLFDIDLSDLPSGIYFVEVINGGVIQTKKFIYSKSY